MCRRHHTDLSERLELSPLCPIVSVNSLLMATPTASNWGGKSSKQPMAMASMSDASDSRNTTHIFRFFSHTTSSSCDTARHACCSPSPTPGSSHGHSMTRSWPPPPLLRMENSIESPASKDRVSDGRNTGPLGRPPDSTSLKKLSAPSANLSNLRSVLSSSSSAFLRRNGTKRLAAWIRSSPSSATRLSLAFQCSNGGWEMWRSSETATMLRILRTAIWSLSALSSALSWLRLSPDRIDDDILLTASVATADPSISAINGSSKARAERASVFSHQEQRRFLKFPACQSDRTETPC